MGGARNIFNAAQDIRLASRQETGSDDGGLRDAIRSPVAKGNKDAAKQVDPVVAGES